MMSADGWCEGGARHMDPPRLTLRIDFGDGRALGPGKVRLLEAIDRTGSISQAGRVLGMSYRRAWLLVDDLNSCFRDSVIVTQPGGAHGGGATLTPFGQDLVSRYRAIESEAMEATRKHLTDLKAALREADRPRAAPLKRSLKPLARKGEGAQRG